MACETEEEKRSRNEFKLETEKKDWKYLGRQARVEAEHQARIAIEVGKIPH